MCVAVPELIPIKRVPGYHTDTIGRYADGQFFACVTGAHARLLRPDADLAQQQRWYAVLHRFDHEGHHTGSDIQFTGTTGDGRRASVDEAVHLLRQWLGELADPVYGDIAVKPFRTELDGVVFGLVDVSDEHGDHVELYPNHLGFFPPWNGSYDT